MQGNLNLCRVHFHQLRLIPLRAPSSSPLSFPSVYLGISSWKAVRMRERARVQWLCNLWENDRVLLAHRTKCKKQIAIAFMTTLLMWIVLIFSLKSYCFFVYYKCDQLHYFTRAGHFVFFFAGIFFLSFVSIPPALFLIEIKRFNFLKHKNLLSLCPKTSPLNPETSS